mmetsp:Transcript_5285/g.12735  ORF Transcript_5285/g.12735 Transcript_5285/m.12735 type:complete len:234 (+) Transcript_5285:44-745(+)
MGASQCNPTAGLPQDVPVVIRSGDAYESRLHFVCCAQGGDSPVEASEEVCRSSTKACCGWKDGTFDKLPAADASLEGRFQLHVVSALLDQDCRPCDDTPRVPQTDLVEAENQARNPQEGPNMLAANSAKSVTYESESAPSPLASTRSGVMSSSPSPFATSAFPATPATSSVLEGSLSKPLDQDRNWEDLLFVCGEGLQANNVEKLPKALLRGSKRTSSHQSVRMRESISGGGA